MNNLTKGIRKLNNISHAQIQLLKSKTLLTYMDNGDSKYIRITKKTAEILIAQGFSYGN